MHLYPLIAALLILSGLISALLIAWDLYLHPQSMRIMHPVWILTGLWAGLPSLWAYYAFGRTKPQSHDIQTNGMQMGMHSMKGMPINLSAPDTQDGGMEMKMQMHRPHWQSVILSTLHCGAGCTLADILGEWFCFFAPFAIGGSLVAASWVTDYLLALLFGIGFQYAAIRGMEHLSRRKALACAAKADVLSLTAWQVGMYGWMAVVIFAMHDGTIPSRLSFGFWFMMQAAMYCGFLVALPVNAWLIRSGIKQGM